MKIKKLILSVPFLFIACTNEMMEDLSPPANQQLVTRNTIEETTSYYVSYEEALAKVTDLFKHEDDVQTRSTIRSVKEHYEYVANPQTRSIDTNEIEVKFHIINFEDNAGFAVVSTDSRTTDIYAYSTTGNLDLNNALTNSGISIFFANAIPHYQAEIANTTAHIGNTRADITPLPDEDDITSYLVTEYNGEYYYTKYEDPVVATTQGPLLTVEWNQTSPYNYYCPEVDSISYSYDGRAAVGCAPVAMGQIMSYFKHPSSVGNYTFNWDAIMYNSSYSYYDFSEEALSTAFLLKTIGLYAGTTYGVSSPTAYNNISTTFSEFGYNFSTSSFDATKVKGSLNSNYPVSTYGVAAIDSIDTIKYVAHQWVIDGYQIRRRYVTYYYTYSPYEKYTTDYWDTLYYRCNWGWGGKHDGWYTDVFYADEKSFRYSNLIIYNIRPQ